MRICGMSDLHGYLPNDIEPCELVCICGDISPLNIQTNHRKMKKWLIDEFKPWCEVLPCDKVVFIAGNHDSALRNLDFMYTQFPKEGKVTYLFHELYTYISKSGKEYEIFGTPYCKLFGNWAFMELNEKLAELYSDIPEGIDLLLCHDQPYGYNDVILDDVPWANGSHIGNKPLALEVLKKQPKVMLTGHLHSTEHSCIKINNTDRYNVSLLNDRYEPTYSPTYIEL